MDRARQPLLFYNSEQDTITRTSGVPYAQNENVNAQAFRFTPGGPTIQWTQSNDPTVYGLGDIPGGETDCAYMYTNSTFYSLGGVRTPEDTVQAGLVTQDFSTGIWANATVTITDDSGYRAGSRAVLALMFGHAGYMVVLGGETRSSPGVYAQGTNMIDMLEITLFDLDSRTWYKQTASGDVPPARTHFCMVGVESGDGKKFDISIYGGEVINSVDSSRGSDEGFLRVYTLSLPAFQWVQSASTTPIRRAGHTCSIIGKRQMVSVGGFFPSSDQSLGGESDPWVSGLGIFDLTKSVWTSSYDASADPYEQPKDIAARYDAISYVEPVWSDAALASAFRFNASASTTSGSAPSSTDASVSPVPSTSSSTPTGAIAGGVVGGIVLLAIGAGLFVFYRRRSRKRGKRGNAEHETPVTEAGSKQRYEAGSIPILEADDGRRNERYELPDTERKGQGEKRRLYEMSSRE